MQHSIRCNVNMVLVLLLFGLVAVLAVAVLSWFIVQFRYIIYLRKIPGPPRIPVLGNALDFPNSVAFLPKLLEFKNKYGGIYQISFGFQQPHIIVSDHNIVQFILSSTKILDKSINYKFLHKWLGQGLLTSTGSLWKSHRKIISPAFHFKILEQFVEIFDRNVSIFIESLQDELNSESFDIYRYVTLLSLDIICESALGTEVNAQNNSHSEYVKSVKFACKLLMQRTFTPYLQSEFLFQFSNLYEKEKKALKILHSMTESVIRQKADELKSKGPMENDDDDDGSGIKKKLAFLDLLLRSKMQGSNMSDKEIREEVDTFMFEGHDTISSAISFTIHCLSKNPHVQEKILEEIGPICGFDRNYSFSYTDLQNMKYLEATIKEGLRLYPSVPVYGRTFGEDTEFDGVLYPKGTIALIFPFGMARDEKFFPEPEKFDPDRFLNYNISNQYPYAYLPFSAGPRNCIGQKYAVLEMKFTLARFILNYEVLPAIPEQQLILESEATLKSANGVNVRIKRRT